MKTALIIGSEGQDGRIAFEFLLQQRYRVSGLGRGASVDITNKNEVFQLMQKDPVDEIYYLAACHQSSQDKLPDDISLFEESHQIHVQGLLYFLEGIRAYAPQARLFYAASSLIFESTSTEIQDEQTPFSPDSIYGMTKLEGLLLCRYYRKQFGIFASSGILYNHESPYRRENFVSAKIIKAAVNISRGKKQELFLGDLNAQIDWGYAPDYVDAMHKILNTGSPDEFIIASGIKHTVRDFAREAFHAVGLDYSKHVKEAPGTIRRKRKALAGDPRKLMAQTGWRPAVDFKRMVKLLVDAELRKSS